MAIVKKKKTIPKIETIFTNLYLTDLDWFDLCYQIDNLENYFSHDSSKKIIKSINEKYREYGQLPSFDDLETDYELGESNNIETIKNFQYEVNQDSFKLQVEKYFKHQAFLSSLAENMKDFNLKNISHIDENLSAFEKSINDVIQFQMAKKTRIVDGAESLEFMTKWLAEEVNPENLLATGYEDVDEMLGGGFLKKTLNVFIAGTHVGKTLTKTNIAINMAEAGHDVLYIPLEMSNEEMHRRMFSRVLQEATVDINVSSWEEQKKIIAEWYNKTVKGSIRFAEYSVKELTSVMLENLCKEYKKIYGKWPDAVYVDSGNLMKSRLPSSNSHDQGEDIANDLKGIGQRCDTAVIVSVQLNREGIDSSKNHGDADMSKVAGSVYWIQVADNIFILTVDPDDPNTLIIKSSKNRNTGITDRKVYLKRNTTFQHIYDKSKVVTIEKKMAADILEINKEAEELSDSIF